MKKLARKHRAKKSKNLPEMDSKLEQEFYLLLKKHNFPLPKTQHTFTKERKWRLDFAWVMQKIAVEIQGYGPGHTSYQGMHSDYEKHNTALALNWKLYYFMSKDIQEPNDMLTFLSKALDVTFDPIQQEHRWETDVARARQRLHKRANRK